MKKQNNTNTPLSEKTPVKHQLPGGKGKLRGNVYGKGFDSRPQPSGEAKSKGRQKKRFTRFVIGEMLNMKYKFTPESFKQGVAKQLKEAFGTTLDEMTIGELMTAQQIQKAILKGDQLSFQTLMNQAMGLPKQDLDIKSGGEKIAEVDYSKLSDTVLQAILNASIKEKA